MARVETCKLYRGVYDIIHPSISRKNISEYKIVLDEDIAPIRVFYPKKEISLEKVIIYIPGEDINYDFYDSFAKQSNRMIFMLDWIARFSFFMMAFISGDEIYLVLALLWEIWCVLVKIKNKLK